VPVTEQRTNRDAYQEVLHATEDVDRPLEEYLRALWQLGRAEQARESLPADVVVGMLIEAVSAPAPPFDDSWRTADLGVGEGMSEFQVWELVILSQIADLRDFAEGPPQYYPELGVDAPRREDGGRRACGVRWYNHAVRSYLECAMAGALGGWDEEDGIRKPVPGPSVQLYPEPEGVFALPPLSWREMTDLLVCGQEYE
jgi:hypothetical protein